MNAFLLLIPFLLIRFGLLSLLNKDAIRRAAYFAPMIGKEVPAYLIYQVSNIAIFVYLCFLQIKVDNSWMCYAGIITFVLGLILCVFILLFIICSYWIILSEERWCVEKFGESYKQYMKEVRRFI